MSGSYERVNLITSFGFSHFWRKRSVEGLPSTDRPVEILDLLTGMGENWSFIMERFPGCRLSALDFSDGMLDHARKRNSRLYQGKVLLLKEDVLHNDLPDGRYDMITCSFGLKTFEDEQLRSLATQLLRLLKPGGQFSFIEVSNPKIRPLSWLYGFYLGRIIPILGWMLAGNPESYRMLWTYTKKFGHVGRAVGLFRDAGLQVKERRFFWGCATGMTGNRPLA